MTDAQADDMRNRLAVLRESFRARMNNSVENAQSAAAMSDMDSCSLHSTESARYQEAFSALSQALKIVDDFVPA